MQPNRSLARIQIVLHTVCTIVWRNKKCDLWLWPQKLVLHSTPSIKKKAHQRTSLSFWFAAKKYRFIFCLHRMSNSVRGWRLRERECKGRPRDEAESKTGGYFLFFFMPGMSRKILICGLPTVCSFLIISLSLALCLCIVYACAYVVEFWISQLLHARNARSITFYYCSYMQQPFRCDSLLFGGFSYARRRKITDTNVFNLHWNNLFVGLLSFVLFSFVLLANGEWWFSVICSKVCSKYLSNSIGFCHPISQNTPHTCLLPFSVANGKKEIIKARAQVRAWVGGEKGGGRWRWRGTFTSE